MDILSYILAKKYTDSSLSGMGALKGASAQIQSITDNPDGTHDIVFEWEDNEGNTYTDTLVVRDGVNGTNGTDGTDGTNGVGIASIEKTGTSGLVDTYTITLTNGDTETFTVTNGSNGTNGTNGTNGETPTMSSEAITGGNRLTFSTTGQSVSIDVMDGVTPDLGSADISSIGDGTVKGAIASLENQIEEMSDEGTKNLLPNNNRTITKSGITYTVNDDGTISVDGTPTASSGLYQTITLPAGSYKFSSCPVNGSDSTYYAQIPDLNVIDTGSGATFTLNAETTFQVSLARISSRANMTFDNLVFKPMITLADTPDSDYDHYVPYSKTNIELTKDLAGKLDVTAQYAYSRYTEWQSSLTTAVLTMTSSRHRKTVLLISNENVAFLYFYKNNDPTIAKINGFNDLTVTLSSGTLENGGTATYTIFGLTSYGSNVIVDWSPNSGTNSYNDVVSISLE